MQISSLHKEVGCIESSGLLFQNTGLSLGSFSKWGAGVGVLEPGALAVFRPGTLPRVDGLLINIPAITVRWTIRYFFPCCT